MIIRMAKVEIIGPKQDLLPVLDLLHGRGVFQPDPQLLVRLQTDCAEPPRALVLSNGEIRERSFFQDLLERVNALVKLLPDKVQRISPLQPLPVMDVLDAMVNRHLEEARELTKSLVDGRNTLTDQQRDLAFWQVLEPLLAGLPARSNLAMFGVTIRDAHQLASLEQLLQQRTGGSCHVSSATAEDGTLIGLIATDQETAESLRTALDEKRVPELPLPEDLVGLTLPQRIAALASRVAEQQAFCRDLEDRLADLARRWLPIYRRARIWLEERLALYRATATACTTRLCFVIQGWMAKDEVSGLRDDLVREFGGRVVIEQQEILEEDLDQVPVQLRNPGYFAPFEIFSRLLPLPKYASYDPTPFIGIFFPILFGMILGDIGYGLILLPLALFLARRFPPRSLVSDLGKVLSVAAACTLLFGLLFGEFFGDLGETRFGLHPLWVDRSKAILPMIIFSISIGVAHIFLGILFGAWAKLRRHQPREALLKLAMLLAVLLLLLALVSWLQPESSLATGPLLAAVGILLPVLILAEGLLAPLELLKTLGNIISYVRIMAIGLCSVLLAVVANRLGGMTGDVLAGILVAGVLHGFNLLLGVFAPTVHALRLHYVEFFSKFLDLGGRRFEPWRRPPHNDSP